MDLEHVVRQVKEGRLLAVTFLSERGREENEIPDHPCADARAEGERFAFFHAFAPCAHAVEVDRVEEIGDEVFLHGRTGDARLRVRVSPVWLAEQREVLAAWAREKDAALVGRELGRVLA